MKYFSHFDSFEMWHAAEINLARKSSCYFLTSTFSLFIIHWIFIFVICAEIKVNKKVNMLKKKEVYVEKKKN